MTGSEESGGQGQGQKREIRRRVGQGHGQERDIIEEKEMEGETEKGTEIETGKDIGGENQIQTDLTKNETRTICLWFPVTCSINYLTSLFLIIP